jgi:hypothetical protein
MLIESPQMSDQFVDYATELAAIKTTTHSITCKSSKSVNMTAHIIGYEAATDALINPSDGVKWICQLDNGSRILVPLKEGAVISAFEAMCFIGRYVELSYKYLTDAGIPVCPFISSLKA